MSRIGRLSIKTKWIGCAGLLLAVMAQAGRAGEWSRDIKALRHLHHKPDECVKKGTALLKAYADDKEKKRYIYGAMVNALNRARRYVDVAKMYETQSKEFQDDSAVVKASLRGMGDAYRNGKKWDDALAAYQSILTRFPKDVDVCLHARLQRGVVYGRTKKFREAIQEYESAEKIGSKNQKAMLVALGALGNTYLALKEYKMAFEAYRRLFTNHIQGQPIRSYRVPIRNMVTAATSAKITWAEVNKLLSRLESLAKDRATAAAIAFDASRIMEAAGDFASAREQLFRCQLRYSQDVSHLFNCQRKIVAFWVKDKKLDQALKEARVLFDLSYDQRTLGEACMTVANLIKDLDQNVTRANQFLSYQKYGPLGKDGKVKTADDPKNALAKVPYPHASARAKLFEQARTGPSDDALRIRQNANLYQLEGRNKEARREFQRYFKTVREDQVQQAANQWILIGVKAAQGHARNLQQYYDWLNFGAGGKDGKGGAKNPFAKLP